MKPSKVKKEKFVAVTIDFFNDKGKPSRQFSLATTEDKTLDYNLLLGETKVRIRLMP